MKKLSIIAMACALLLTLSQCKKNETTTNEGEKVYVSVKIANGAKQEVNPTNGVVTYEANDVLHVASAGVYLGTLTYDGTQFSGDINEPTEGQKLQFYFLGNVTPDFNADNSQCSVVISDQTEHLPVISAAPSVEDYTAGLTNYTATLLHKCALVKFDVTTSSTAATCITGFNNKVTVNFAENSFAYSKDGDGVITLPADNGEQWAILLPQPAMTAGNIGYAYSEDGRYTGSCGIVPAIYENGYFTVGIPVEVTTKLLPQGVIEGLFSVSETQQVYFSQGNLQYIGSAAEPYWRFAANQWLYLGNNGQVSDSPTADRDLFGWATSGYNHGGAYLPWDISSNSFAYGEAINCNLYEQTGQADWGYNAISNGGNQENSGWRTLTRDEWDYVFNYRNNASSKWGHGNVNGVNGMILLPDDWTLEEPSFTSGNSDWANVYNAQQWAQMEANGAVFLPAAGYRYGGELLSVGSHGGYWSSSRTGYVDSSCVSFNSGDLYPQVSYRRLYGNSVRLVRNAE